MADKRKCLEHELLRLTAKILAELDGWLAVQRLSEPDITRRMSDEVEPAQSRDVPQQQYRARDRPGVRQHDAERRTAYEERFSERMAALYDGLVACRIHPDVSRPMYVNGGAFDLIIEPVIGDLELIILRLKARLERT